MSNSNKIKTVYSFRVKNLLEVRGFKPILETDNPMKEGFKCQVFEASPAFKEAFEEIAFGKEANNG